MIIADSTVLIVLGNIRELRLLPRFLVPERVLKEITKEPTKGALGDVRVFKPSADSRR